MRRVIAAFVLAVLPGLPQQQIRPSGDAAFEIQKIADGVYAIIHKEPPGLMMSSNVVIIVNDADVVVVDTTVTPSSARAVLAALRELTPKPVKYVVNTHWHDDHVMGNQVFREAFPNAQFVGHARTEQLWKTTGEPGRKMLLGLLPQMTQQLRMSLEQSKSMGGGTLTEEERRSYQHDLAVAERFAAEAPNAGVVMPSVVVNDKLTLAAGKRTVEVLYLGAGHTTEDLVVHLPGERVLVTGDLVALPIPLAGSTSHPAEFAVTLEKLAALQPAILVPGHGPVVKDLNFVRLEARLFASIAEQVRTAAAAGSSLAQVRKTVNLSEFEKAFAGDSQLLKFLFNFSVAAPGIGAAYRDATVKK
jgi:cyclase